jgi:hypothetical protein
MAVQRARVCIVSREPFQSAHFVAALHSTLGLEDDLEIIVDRRHSESSGWLHLKDDRRRLSEVDVELKANGFAIVPAVDWTDRIDRSRVDGDDRKLEDIRGYLRRRSGPLIPKLIGVFGGVTVAASAALLAGHFNGPSRSSQATGSLRVEPDQPPGQSNASLNPVPARREEPFVPAPSLPARADSAPSSEAGGATRSDSPRDADRITPRPREATDSHVAAAAPKEADGTPGQTGLPPASPAPKETSAPPRATQSAAPRATHDAAVSPPGGPTAKATRVEKSYRAELVGEPSSRGWGDSYAVRVQDSSGAALLDASVELIARMEDGSVENVAMGALTEPGTYRGTVPTNHSTPVDLKLRVTSGGESVEVPLNR